MNEIIPNTPLNSFIDEKGTLHIVQDTTFNQPIRIYNEESGKDEELENLEIKGTIKAIPTDPSGHDFTITKTSKTQMLVTLSFEITGQMIPGFYYYEIESLDKEKQTKENLLRGRCIVYRNIK